MSQGARRIWLGGTIAIVLALAGYFVWQKIHNHPSDSALLACLDREVGAGKARFSKLERNDVPTGNDRVQGALVAHGSVAEPLYTAVDTSAYLRSEFNWDARPLAEARRLLAGASGPRIREIAGLVEDPPDPLKVAILREVSARAAPVVYRCSLWAERGANGWTLRLTEGRFDGDAPAGEPRSTYTGKTYIAGDATDAAALRALIEQQQKFCQRIVAARDQYQEERRRTRDERLARYASLFQPGTLFTGSVTLRRNQQSAALVLELVDLKGATRQVAALLRNDGGWSDARKFQGEWRTDADAETLSLVLGTRSDQALRGAGPILDLVDTWNIAFQVDADGNLLGTSNDYEYRFVRVPAAQVAGVKAELTATQVAALAASAAGVVYQGVAVARRDQASESVLLRFTRQENDGALLAASLESAEHPSWHRTLRGTVATNRYRNGDQPIRLRLSRGDNTRRAPDRSVFGWGGDLALALRVDDAQLTGEDEVFTYRFTRLSVEQVQQLAADRASREQKFFNLVRAGAVYDGTVRDGTGFISRVRLRFIAIDQGEGSLTAAIDSREQNGVFHEWKGAFDAAEGILALGSSGRGHFNPNGNLRVPFLSRHGSFRLNLTLDETGFTGELVDYNDWRLLFPARARTTPMGAGPAVDPATGLPVFPASSGAYVLAEGRWQPLPRNGGRVTYGVTQVLNGVSDFLGALGGKPIARDNQTQPDKMADLTFAGTDPVPEVNGAEVILLYLGAIKPLSADLLQKYPQLRDYPLIEMAPTRRTSDGRRQVDLLRIAPGLAGFRDQRVAAILDEPKTGATLVTCTSTLASGSYALAVNTEAYELNVR